MQKKVLFFLFGGCGGAERMTLNIAKLLPLDKFDVKFVVCGRRNEIYPFIPEGYEVEKIRWHNVHVFPRTRLALMMWKEKPDYVFSSTMLLNTLVIQAAKFLGIKAVVRNDNMIQYVDSGMQRILAKNYPYAYRVIAQQEEMQTDIINLIGTNDKHVICLHNPVDIDTINKKLSEDDSNPYPNDNSINYLWVGNYLETKGHDILAEAFKIVHAKNPNTHLYFVGKIKETLPNYIKTKRIVSDAKLENYVHFMGQQTNPYRWMKYCSCFVLPSRMEGLPNVLLEAMYLKCPVVASVCIPVIDRMVKEGYNGYKVKPQAPEKMAEAMEKALMLKNFKPTFKTATQEDFVSLFN